MGGLNMNVLIIILILVVLFVIPNVIIVPQAREYVLPIWKFPQINKPLVKLPLLNEVLKLDI